VGLVVVIALTFVALSSAAVLLGTVGRRRRGGRGRALPPARRRALEDAVGSRLADVVAEARVLRGRLEAVAANGRDMVQVENAMGRAPRRPLWRQLEDANFERDLERINDDVRALLARLEGLTGPDRQILDEVRPPLDPLHDLLGATWTQPPPGVDRRPTLERLEGRFARAIAVLGELDSRIEAYRPRAYR
jgi:hypothetical protein